MRAAALWTALALAVTVGFCTAARADTITILGLGDSLMAGYGLDRASSFPTQLEAALRQRGHDVHVINAGVSGDTSAGGRARLDWSLAEKPDAAIVELGANDALRGLPTDALHDNLEAIVTKLERRNIPTLLVGMRAPPNLGSDYEEEFLKAYTDIVDAHDVLFYPFFLQGVAADPVLNQADGMHPNAEGVAEIVKRILPAVEELIFKVGKQRGSAG